MGCLYANAPPVSIYNTRQRPQSKFVTWRNINGVASKATNTAAVSTNTILYLITCARASG